MFPSPTGKVLIDKLGVTGILTKSYDVMLDSSGEPDSLPSRSLTGSRSLHRGNNTSASAATRGVNGLPPASLPREPGSRRRSASTVDCCRARRARSAAT